MKALLITELADLPELPGRLSIAREAANNPIPAAVFRRHRPFSVLRVAFSPDSTHVVTTSDDNTARVWRVDGTGEAIVLRGHEGEVWNLAFSPDGTRLVTASDDDTARVWRADGTGEPIVFRGHEDYVGAVSFNPVPVPMPIT